jgi:hypothetical protein
MIQMYGKSGRADDPLGLGAALGVGEGLGVEGLGDGEMVGVSEGDDDGAGEPDGATQAATSPAMSTTARGRVHRDRSSFMSP